MISRRFAIDFQKRLTAFLALQACRSFNQKKKYLLALVFSAALSFVPASTHELSLFHADSEQFQVWDLLKQVRSDHSEAAGTQDRSLGLSKLFCRQRVGSLVCMIAGQDLTLQWPACDI